MARHAAFGVFGREFFFGKHQMLGFAESSPRSLWCFPARILAGKQETLCFHRGFPKNFEQRKIDYFFFFAVFLAGAFFLAFLTAIAYSPFSKFNVTP